MPVVGAVRCELFTLVLCIAESVTVTSVLKLNAVPVLLAILWLAECVTRAKCGQRRSFRLSRSCSFRSSAVTRVLSAQVVGVVHAIRFLSVSIKPEAISGNHCLAYTLRLAHTFCIVGNI